MLIYSLKNNTEFIIFFLKLQKKQYVNSLLSDKSKKKEAIKMASQLKS